MENVDDLTDLMANIVESNSSETALKLFNVLHPYDKPLPNIDEDEDIIKEFYEGSTKQKFDPVGDLKRTTPQALKERLAAQGINNLMSEKERKDLINEYKESQEEYVEDEEMVSSKEIEDLKTLLRSTEAKLEDALKECDKLKITIDEREETIEELREQLQQSNNKGNDEDLLDQGYKIKELEDELISTQTKLENAKNQLLTNKKEYEKLVADIPELKELEAIRRAMETAEKQRQLDNQRNRALRFKSGLLFQKALEKLDKASIDVNIKNKQDSQKTGDYYLTDDAALIRFLITVERNQPPSLYQRLLDADVERKGGLKNSQFTSILNDLQITPQDSLSLQRIAGFSSGQKVVQIDDFIKTIKERKTVRQDIEIKTFKKVQKAIRKEGWTIKEAFDVFDIDKNNYIDYQEMIDGFKKLKVHVPNQHLKSIFAILDEDGSGSISLQEFQARLDPTLEDKEDALADENESEEQYDEEYYKLKEEEKKAKEDEEKKKALLKDREIENYKDQLSRDKIKTETDPLKRKQQEEIKQKLDKDANDAYSKELINGELKVQVGKGIDIVDVRTEGCNYFYIVFYLEGTNENNPYISKPIKYFSRMSFQWSAKIPMINVHPKELDNEFNIKIYASKGEYESSSFVGEVYCKWKPTIEQPNQYVIANNYELIDQYNSCAFGKVQGKVMISAKFVPAGAKDSDFTEDGEGKESIKKTESHANKNVQFGPMTKIGDLNVEIFNGRGFESKIRHVLFLRLQGASKTHNKEMTKTVKDKDKPEFNEKIIIPVYKRETEDIPLLVIQDVDPDQEDILCSLDINFAKIANTDSVDIFEKKWYAFNEDKHKEIEVKLTFTNANYKEEKPKPKPKPVENKQKLEEKVVPPPKFSEFLIDDSAIPDPKDTGKFRDEFPSEPSEKPISEYDHDSEDPPKIGQFNINDATVDIQQDSGNFDEI